MKLVEVRKEDDLYFIGPFWIIGNSLSEINKGNFNLIAEKFLVDYNGIPVQKVPKLQFTHKGIWEARYKSTFGKEYNYYPRGRISFKEGEWYLNIPDKLNKDIVVPKIKQEYDIKENFEMIKSTDPTTGNHYSFELM